MLPFYCAILFAHLYILEAVVETSCREEGSESCTEGGNGNQITNITKIVQALIQQESNKLCRPYPQGGKPVVITAELNLVSISNFREADMEFTVEMYFRETWHDPRLAYGNNSTLTTITLNGELSESLWQPDTYFENEIHGKLHTLMVKNKYMRITKDGGVMTSSRITLSCSCAMDFRKFPMDKQQCGIYFSSYGYTTADIVYKWAPDRVAWSKDQEIAQFNLEHIEMINLTRKYITGHFSALGIKLRLNRRLGHYLTRVYVPAVLIVMLSWLSFYLDRHSAPARVSLGITTVLTMTTLLIGIGQGSLPVVSYVKALDWYLFVSYCMVFGAFAEYAVINYRDKSYFMQLRRRRHAQNIQQDIQNGSAGKPLTDVNTTELLYRCIENNENSIATEAFEIAEPLQHEKANCCSEWITQKFLTPPGIIDEWSKKLFPLLYILFNAFYWLYYLVISD